VELHSKPVTVRYDITPYGSQIEKMIAMLVQWGQQHRTTLFDKK
jgi:DNA-binding HxlR family transcriptional regulator